MRIGKTYKRVIAMMLAANLVAGFMSVTTQTKVSATQQAGAVRAENTILTTDQAIELYKQDKVYYIDPSSEPLAESKLTSYTAYNSKTRNYFTLRSYVEKFSEDGGGTLVLQKGTYEITNTIFVPSNVTIILEDGVTLKKSMKTGTSQMNAVTSMFQFVSSENSQKKGYGKGYSGCKNINIIGIGSAVIDLSYVKTSIAIIMGHNSNVTISGIQFMNMNTGHFIEMDASQNVKVQYCSFANAKKGSDYVKEAINIDTPDKETQGFNSQWSSMDKTPNRNVTISDCTFEKLGRAIGTHKYSVKKSKQMMHTNITITNNIIKNMYNDAPIRAMNWKNAVISNNTIDKITCKINGKTKKDTRGILLSGTVNATVTLNKISNVGRAIQFIAWKNTGAGSSYPAIKDKLSTANKTALANNAVSNLGLKENFVRITYQYNKYDNAEKIAFN